MFAWRAVRRARQVKYSLSIPAARLPASAPESATWWPTPGSSVELKPGGWGALSRWPPQGAWGGGETGRGAWLPRPAPSRGRCPSPPAGRATTAKMASPGDPRKGLRSGLGLNPRLPDTHHVSQAAELLQPEEQALDGLLHLLRLKRANILEISKWFPGRQTPFIFFFFLSKLNLRIILPVPSRPTFPFQNLLKLRWK